MWADPQEIVDSVTFTEEILNGKLHFCIVVNFATIFNDWTSLAIAVKLSILHIYGSTGNASVCNHNFYCFLVLATHFMSSQKKTKINTTH